MQVVFSVSAAQSAFGFPRITFMRSYFMTISHVSKMQLRCNGALEMAFDVRAFASVKQCEMNSSFRMNGVLYSLMIFDINL